MKQQHTQTQRSYRGFSRQHLCVGLLPIVWLLSKGSSSIFFGLEVNNEDTYKRPWYNETQV